MLLILFKDNHRACELIATDFSLNFVKSHLLEVEHEAYVHILADFRYKRKARNGSGAFGQGPPIIHITFCQNTAILCSFCLVVIFHTLACFSSFLIF